jgi:hypothetical protein
MKDHSFGATLVRYEHAAAGRTAVLAPTYPTSAHAEATVTDAISHLKAARVELRAGRIDSAIGMTRIVSGRCARLGDQQVASLLRRAAWVAPFGQIESADALIGQASAALASR